MKFFAFIAALTLLVAPVPVSAQQAPPLPIASCSGFAQPTGKTVLPICRTAYLSGYDPAAKIPAWVSYTLTPEHTVGCVSRSNAFRPDESLPEAQRASLDDYAHSGYDIGHNAPDGDMNWDVNVERESFILTNMTPQLPGLNRGIWRTLETAVRTWAYQRKHTLAIYTGPLYGAADKKIGDGVTVPHGYFKVVVDTQTNETLAFIFKQVDHQGLKLAPLQVTVADVEAQSGLVLPVADKNSKPAIWAYDARALGAAKKAACTK